MVAQAAVDAARAASWLPVKPPERPSGEARPYTGQAAPGALDALKDACEEIKAARPPGRNTAINCASYHIGRRIGAGQLDKAQAIGALTDAVEHMQHASANLGREIRKIECAIEAGKRRPLEAPRLPTRPEETLRWLRGVAQRVERAARGESGSLCLWGARKASELLRAGPLPPFVNEDWVADLLACAAVRAGLPESEARRTIASGLRRT